MSSPITAAELLAEMKERAASQLEVGNYTPILLLQEDPALRKLVAVWPNVPVARDANPNEVVPADLRPLARLDWLWARINPDPIDDWIRIAGLPVAPHIQRLCRVAIDNRMVLPDGTLTGPIRAYLNAMVNVGLAPALAAAERQKQEQRRREEEERRRRKNAEGEGDSEQG